MIGAAGRHEVRVGLGQKPNPPDRTVMPGTRVQSPQDLPLVRPLFRRPPDEGEVSGFHSGREEVGPVREGPGREGHGRHGLGQGQGRGAGQTVIADAGLLTLVVMPDFGPEK